MTSIDSADTQDAVVSNQEPWLHLESALRDIPAPGRFKSLTCSEHAALAERVSILALQPDPYDARGFAYPRRRTRHPPTRRTDPRHPRRPST